MKTNVYVSNVDKVDPNALELPVTTFTAPKRVLTKEKVAELNADPSRGAGPDEEALLLPRMFDDSSACD